MTRAKKALSIKHDSTAQNCADHLGRKSLPKPFLKWVGGKGQLVPQLLGHLPDDFNSYHEPFLGGGAMFFALRRAGLLNGKKVFLSDVNQELIHTYQAIRDRCQEVMKILCSHRNDREHYYEIRSLDPIGLSPAERAARTIFLNRVGFNGLYRVNSKGHFNVPFGQHKNPQICDQDNLLAVSQALAGVEILCSPFGAVSKRAKRGDLVYFDPPYVPVSKTSYFVSYAKDGFSIEDQKHLAKTVEVLSKRRVYVMLSNSDVDWIQERYERYKQIKVQARRNVNSRGDKRGPVGELLIANFKLSGACS